MTPNPQPVKLGYHVISFTQKEDCNLLIKLSMLKNPEKVDSEEGRKTIKKYAGIFGGFSHQLERFLLEKDFLQDNVKSAQDALALSFCCAFSGNVNTEVVPPVHFIVDMDQAERHNPGISKRFMNNKECTHGIEVIFCKEAVEIPVQMATPL